MTVRLRKRGVSRRLRKLVWTRDKGICQVCGRQTALDQSMHVDHIFPVIRGGCDCLENLRTTCASCNWARRLEERRVERVCQRCVDHPIITWLRELIDERQREHDRHRAATAATIKALAERAAKAEQQVAILEAQLERQQRVWWRKLREMLLGW